MITKIYNILFSKCGPIFFGFILAILPDLSAQNQINSVSDTLKARKDIIDIALKVVKL